MALKICVFFFQFDIKKRNFFVYLIRTSETISLSYVLQSTFMCDPETKQKCVRKICFLYFLKTLLFEVIKKNKSIRKSFIWTTYEKKMNVIPVEFNFSARNWVFILFCICIERSEIHIYDKFVWTLEWKFSYVWGRQCQPFFRLQRYHLPWGSSKICNVNLIMLEASSPSIVSKVRGCLKGIEYQPGSVIGHLSGSENTVSVWIMREYILQRAVVTFECDKEKFLFYLLSYIEPKFDRICAFFV